MIVVKIEMWPKGDESRAVEIGRARIVNTGARTAESGGEYGSYNVQIYGGVHGRPEVRQRLWKRGIVEDFPRRRRGAWDLLLLALQQCIGRRT